MHVSDSSKDRDKLLLQNIYPTTKTMSSYLIYFMFFQPSQAVRVTWRFSSAAFEVSVLLHLNKFSVNLNCNIMNLVIT